MRKWFVMNTDRDEGEGEGFGEAKEPQTTK